MTSSVHDHYIDMDCASAAISLDYISLGDALSGGGGCSDLLLSGISDINSIYIIFTDLVNYSSSVP